MATYKVGEGGKAPPGLKKGDTVVTGGGTYSITGVNDDGTYQSQLLSKDITTYNTPESEYAPAPSGIGGMGGGINYPTSAPRQTTSNYTGYLNTALRKAKDAQRAATDAAVQQLQAQEPDILQAYRGLRGDTYANARMSAIGNNEMLASQGLAGNLYSAPRSGVSETSRIAQDNALRTGIGNLNMEEQRALQRLKTAIAQARMAGEQSMAGLESDYYGRMAQAQQGDAERRYSEYMSNRAFDYQAGQDTIQNELRRQSFEYGQQQDSLANTQASGWNILQAGVMPSEDQLSTMGITPEQAAAYIKTVQQELARRTAGSGGKGSGGGANAKGYSLSGYAQNILGLYMDENYRVIDKSGLIYALESAVRNGLISEQDRQAALILAGVTNPANAQWLQQPPTGASGADIFDDLRRRINATSTTSIQDKFNSLKAQPTASPWDGINMQSVYNLGLGDVSRDELERWVDSGELEVFNLGGELHFRFPKR